MISPEWKARLQESISNVFVNATVSLNNHATEGKNDNDTGGDIHRAIYVSTKSPTTADGENGDIWITIEG